MADEPKLGKQGKWDVFPAAMTVEQVKEAMSLQEQYNKPEAVPLEVYFVRRGIVDVGAQAARRAYTKVTSATIEDWDEIFKAAF